MATLSPRILRILLAVDGSEHALAATALLRDLPWVRCKPHGDEPPSECLVKMVAVLIPRQAQMHYTLLNALEQARAILLTGGVPVDAEIVTGYPAPTLIEIADGMKPDMIVLGARGLRATLGILLGGVAQQVIEYAHWPTLVVRAPYHGLHHALLVTDGSPSSQCALEFMHRFDLPEGCDLTLMHVLPPIPTPELLVRSWPADLHTASPISIQEMEEVLNRQAETEEQEGRALLEHAQRTLASFGIQAHTAIARGDAATEIIDYVKEHQIDLIIAGSRGLGAVRSWLLGSVSRKLVHYAGCSVLIVRGAA